MTQSSRPTGHISQEAKAVADAFVERVSGGIVGVLRSSSLEQARVLAEAAISAGLSCIEITWTTPGAEVLIHELRQRYSDLLIGAGSLFTAEEARAACDAGAGFLVSPHLGMEVLNESKRRGILYIPGASTPSEVLTATTLDCALVKPFPIKQLGGPDYVRALLGPIPGLRCMVTGGIERHQVREYFNVGVTLVGLGSIFGQNETDTFQLVSEMLADL